MKELVAAILRVDSKKTPDPYGLHPRFLKLCKFLTRSFFYTFLNRVWKRISGFLIGCRLNS